MKHFGRHTWVLTLLGLGLISCGLKEVPDLPLPSAPPSASAKPKPQPSVSTLKPSGDNALPDDVRDKVESGVDLNQDAAVQDYIRQQAQQLTSAPDTETLDLPELTLAEIVESEPEPAASADPLAAYPKKTNPVFTANHVELFYDDAEIYPMVLETVARAQTQIQVDLFIFGGEVGMDLAKALVERHKAGVEVNLMLDGNMGFVGPTKKDVENVIKYLKKEGLGYRIYQVHHLPSSEKLLKDKGQIDHNKLMVVDNRWGIIGGMNFFDAARTNRDVMLRLEGPLVQEMGQLMALDWNLPPKPAKPEKNKLDNNEFGLKAVAPRAAETARVRLVKTDAFEQNVRERLIYNINNARKSIYFSIFEFSDEALTNALVKAHERGVDVRILMDPKNVSDKYAGGVPVPAHFPNILPMQTFVDKKIPARWFKPFRENQELHMKAAIFDNERVIVGSTNFSTRAFTMLRETSIELIGHDIPQRMTAEFMEDWEKHSEVQGKLNAGDKLAAATVAYIKKHIGWW